MEHFWIAFSRHWHPFQALNCPIGVPWDITTPQRSHSESLRSSFEGRIFEVRKNLGGAHRRSLVCAALCGHFVVERWYLSSSGVPMVQCRCRGQSELSQVQASASETQMERRYDPKRAAKTTSACESACAKARESRAGKISAQNCESCESASLLRP